MIMIIKRSYFFVEETTPALSYYGRYYAFKNATRTACMPTISIFICLLVYSILRMKREAQFAVLTENNADA
jgi:hypothetical protein